MRFHLGILKPQDREAFRRMALDPAVPLRRLTGKMWTIREDADSALARIKFPDQLAFDTRQLTDAQRKELVFRKRVLDDWAIWRQGALRRG